MTGPPCPPNIQGMLADLIEEQYSSGLSPVTSNQQNKLRNFGRKYLQVKLCCSIQHHQHLRNIQRGRTRGLFGKVSIRVPIWKSTLNLCRFKYWLWLTDTDRHWFRVGSHVTNTRLVWDVRDTSLCHQPNQVSVLPVYLSVLANPSFHRGEKRLIWNMDIDIDLSSTV